MEAEVSYLKPYINIMYYLMLVPFRVDLNTKTGEYILKSRRFQKTVCGVFHLSSIYFTIIYFQAYYTQFFALSSDISKLLYTVGNVSGSLAALFGMKVVWFSQPDILRFLQDSKFRCSEISGIFLRNINTLVVFMTIIFYSVQAAFTLSMGTAMKNAINQPLNLVMTLSNIENDSCPPFFIKVLSAVLDVVNAHAGSVYIMPRLLIMFLSLQLTGKGKQFEKFIGNVDAMHSMSVETVRKEYDKLQSIMECLNRWVGGLLLSLYVGVVAFMANIPGVIRKANNSGIAQFYPLLSFLTVGIFFVVACDMPARIRSSCKKWINNKADEGNLTQNDKFLLAILNQNLDSDPVALGSSFFSFTYGFVGSMIGLLTTYGVLVFQMQK